MRQILARWRPDFWSPSLEWVSRTQFIAVTETECLDVWYPRDLVQGYSWAASGLPGTGNKSRTPLR